MPRPRRARLFVRPLEERVTPTAGALDRSFATAGVATLTQLKSVADVAPLPDGGAIVLGTVALGDGTSNDPTADFGVVKLTAAGAVDATFGTAGLATVAFNLQANGKGPDLPAKVVVRPDGRIVALGQATIIGSGTTLSDSQVAVAALTPAGVLDAGFDGDGKLTFKWLDNQNYQFSPVLDLAALPNNTVVLAGTADTPPVFNFPNPNTPARRYVTSARLTAAGAFDTTYDGDGKALQVIQENASFISSSLPQAVGVAADGAVAAVYANDTAQFSDLFGLRVNPDGSRDTTFGPAGTATLGDTGGGSFSTRLVRPTADGKVILVTAQSSSSASTSVTRYLGTGAKDPTYGTDGTFTVTQPASGATTPYLIASDAVPLADGRLLLAGSGNSSLLRLTAAGAPDPTFNADGYVPANFFSGSGSDYPSSATLVRPTATGRLLLASSNAFSSTAPTVTRTLADDSQNTPPILGAVPDSTTVSDSFGPGTVFVRVRDAETPNSLTVTAASSNPAVVPNTSQALSVFLSQDGYVQLNITPTSGATGSSTITLTATDGAGAATTRTFVVNRVATGGNTSPRINSGAQALADQATPAGTPLSLVVFPSDSETATSGLAVTATSSAPNVATVSVADKGNYRVLTVTPAAGATAGQQTTVRVTVTDGGGLTTFGEFAVTIGTPAANQPPAVSDIAAQTATVDTSKTVTFTASDPDAGTSFSTLLAAASSSDQSVVPDSKLIAFVSSFSGGQVSFTPAAAGTATITLVVADGKGAYTTRTFDVTATGGQVDTVPPTITSVGNQTVPPGTPSTLSFTVADNVTPAADLTVIATSSVLGVVPAAGLVLGGQGGVRTLTVTPTAGVEGTTTITLTVSDAAGLTASSSFTYTTSSNTPPPAAPTISPVADVSVPAGTVRTLSFTVNDTETAAADLTVTAVSSNAALVPAAGLVLGGSGAARTVTVTPTAGAAGAATITLTVRDAGGLTATTSFQYVTTPIDTDPAITTAGLSGATRRDDSPVTFTFTVGDAETAAGDLIVTATSDNQGVAATSALVVGGSGATRTVTVTPAGGVGPATITVTVRDAGGRTASTQVGYTRLAPLPTTRLVGSTRTAVGNDDGTFRVLGPDGKAGDPVSPFAGFTGQVRTATGDFNADGVPDVVVGTGPGVATKVRVLDGATGAELFALDAFEASFTGGVYVAAGDVDGDGQPDLIVTPDEGGGPRVRVISGAGFQQLADFFGIDDPNFRGGARAATADVNGDGRTDLVVAAGFGGGPRVAVFDGTSLGGGEFTRKLVPDFFAFEQTLRNGIFLAAGDVTGDGLADLIAGGGPGGGPRVSVFDSKDLLAGTQTRVADYFAGDPARRDGVRVAARNGDGDRLADVVTAVGGVVQGYSGKALAAAPNDPAADLKLDAINGVFVG